MRDKPVNSKDNKKKPRKIGKDDEDEHNKPLSRPGAAKEKPKPSNNNNNNNAPKLAVKSATGVKKPAVKKPRKTGWEIEDDSDEEREVEKQAELERQRALRGGIQEEQADVARKATQQEKKKENKIREQLEKKFEIATEDAIITYDGSEKDEEKEKEESGEQDCLRVRPFSLSFRGTELFKEAAMTLSVGHRYGLVGPNGSGKTTVIRHIANRSLPGVSANLDILHVEQEVEGSDETAIDSVLSADIKRAQLLVEQKDLEKYGEYTEEEDKKRQVRLAEVYSELEIIGAASAPARAAKILNGLQFTQEMQNQATKLFSGGWRMRIALARALFRQPSLLLLDEPTNHLDLHAVIWLEEYLKRWKKTLVIVSHDRDFLNNVCTNIVHLDQKKLVMYKGDFDTFVKTLETKRRAQDKEYQKQQRELQNYKKLMSGDQKAGGKAKKGASKQLTSQQKKQKERHIDGIKENLVEKVKEYKVTFEFPDPERQLDHPVIQVDDVDFKYDDRGDIVGKTIFKALNFGINMESRLSLVGPNGAGKSTLLGLLFGKLSPTSGVLTINKHLKIAYFAQHFADQLQFDVSPVQYLHSMFPDEDYQTIRKYLGKFGLPGKMHVQPIQTLSGGQKNRVLFARLSLMKPDILYLDEPTNHLDMESIEALSDALTHFKGGVIVVSHDARLINAICEEIWVIAGDQRIKTFEGSIYDYRQAIVETLTEEDF